MLKKNTYFNNLHAFVIALVGLYNTIKLLINFRGFFILSRYMIERISTEKKLIKNLSTGFYIDDCRKLIVGTFQKR